LDRMIARYSGSDLAASEEPVAAASPAATAAAGDATASPLVPLLVLNGEHDLKTRLRAGQALSQTAPFVEHALISEAGHLPNLDNPHVYNETIRSFLARHTPLEKPQ